MSWFKPNRAVEMWRVPFTATEVYEALRHAYPDRFPARDADISTFINTDADTKMIYAIGRKRVPS